MKKSILIIIALIAVVLVSCNDNEYIEPVSFADVSWYNSLGPTAPREIAQGKSISFMDLSVGTLSHQWIIEKGNSFLKIPFTTNDSLYKYIDTTLDTINTAATIHVYFPTVGVSKVRLRNTYPVPVSYKGKTTLNAVQEGNVWVIDTTFVFTVK